MSAVMVLPLNYKTTTKKVANLISPLSWNCIANSLCPIVFSARASFSYALPWPLFNHQSNMSVRQSCAKSGEFLLLAWICRNLWRGTPSCTPNCLHSAATGSFTRSFSAEGGTAILLICSLTWGRGCRKIELVPTSIQVRERGYARSQKHLHCRKWHHKMKFHAGYIQLHLGKG